MRAHPRAGGGVNLTVEGRTHAPVACSCRRIALWDSLIAWTSTVSLWTAVNVSWSASARASFAAWITFWPTMMMGSRTSWKNVCATQETMMMTFFDWMAAGSEIRAIAANS